MRGNSLIGILVAKGLANEDACRAAIAACRPGESLGRALVRTRAVADRDLACALAEASKTPLVSLDPYPEIAAPIEPAERRLACGRLADPVSAEAGRLLPREFAEKHRVVLITAHDGVGVLAMADPFDTTTLREAHRRTDLHLRRVTASAVEVAAALERVWSARPPAHPPVDAGARRALLLAEIGVPVALTAFLIAMRDALDLEHLLAVIALGCGLVFFLYALRYYVATAVVIAAVALGASERWSALRPARARSGDAALGYRLLRPDGPSLRLSPERQPFVSVQVALYNEEHVVERLMRACTSFDYDAYEVIVADDSTDGTSQVLERWKDHPRVRVLHRADRAGFKGGALQEALKRMDGRTEYVLVFDADFVPPPDAIWRFLAEFGRLDGTAADHIGAVQGYQWHMLNASENWITRAVRAEFSGSYVVERSAQELGGAMTMISGSVYMIRADLLRRLGWSCSITEDWELTIRLYLAGYRVRYTPYVQAPAECVSRIPQLIRQRMRWARGHTFNVRKYFVPVMRSSRLGWREKAEFLFYAPYYLQSVLFLLGTLSWVVGVLLLGQDLPHWGEVLGWSLVVSNVLALPLMNLAGLLLEGTARRDAAGLIGQVGLSMILVPFQAWAAVRGLLDPHEGGWTRTPKSGRITDRIDRFRLPRMSGWTLPSARLPQGGWSWVATALVFILGALSVRAAAAADVPTELLAVPVALGAGLPLGIVAAGRRGRGGLLVLGLLVALTANVVFLAATVPADATAGTGNAFYLRNATAFGCAGQDMTQTAPTAATHSTLAVENSTTAGTFCSDTFTSAMSLEGGTAVIALWATNTSNPSCVVTATLMAGSTTLGSATLTVPGRTTLPQELTAAITTGPVTFAEGERLSLRLDRGGGGCNKTELLYDSLSRQSRVTTATVVPEALLPLVLAPLLPLALRRLARRP